MRYRGPVRRFFVASALAFPGVLGLALAGTSACSYDWTIAQGGAGDGGPGSGGDAGARTCAAGTVCKCPLDSKTCLLDCPSGQCQMDCSGATSCSVTCGGGQCIITSGTAATAEVASCAGQCSLTCSPGSSCTIASCASQCFCDGDGCR